MHNYLIKAAAKLALGANHLTVLIFHQVLPEPDPMRPHDPSAAEFDALLRQLTQSYTVLPLSAALLRLKQRELPSAALSITFDDGYRNNLTVAAPILNKYGLSACFFSTTAYLNGGMMWNDQVIEQIRTLPGDRISLEWLDLTNRPIRSLVERKNLAQHILRRIKHLPIQDRQAAVDKLGASSVQRMMMNAEELRQLKALGMEIGGHTHNHPIMSTLDVQTIDQELRSNKQMLEAILDQELHGFAYPNGKPEQDYDRRCIEAVKKHGYQWALTTEWGVCKPEDDFYQLSRFTPWSQTPWRFFSQLARNRFYRPQRIG